MKKQFPLSLGIIMLALCAIAAISILYWTIGFHKTPVNNIAAKQQLQPQVQAEIVQTPTATNQTADWETFSGHGISFKYPKAMGQPQVVAISDGTQIEFQDNISFILWNSYSSNLGRDMNMDDLISAIKKNTNIFNLTQKSITVGGITGVEFTYEDKVSAGENITIYVPITQKGIILTAAQYGRDTTGANSMSIDEIIPTVMFTK